MSNCQSEGLFVNLRIVQVLSKHRCLKLIFYDASLATVGFAFAFAVLTDLLSVHVCSHCCASGDPKPILPCHLWWQAAFISPGQLFKNWVYPPNFRRFIVKTTHFPGQLDQKVGLPP